MRHARMWRLVALAWFLATNSASAQSGGDAFAGILGGATLSSFSFWGWTRGSESRLGGTAGLFASIRTSWYSVGTVEVNWVQKGSEYIRLDYVEVPVLAGAVIPTMDGGLRFRGYIGIAPAFRLGCKNNAFFFECDNVNSTEWSLPFGVMIGRWLDSGKFFALDVRYSLALSDVVDVYDMKNRSLQFRAAFGIPLRGGGDTIR